MNEQQVDKETELGWKQFIECLIQALQITLKGTTATRTTTWIKAEGKLLVISIRQANCPADFEDYECGSMCKVTNPGPGNIPDAFKSEV